MISLVSTGVASAAEVDAAMRYGIGPRWAAQGPFINLHLSGGAGGLRRVLKLLSASRDSAVARILEAAINTLG
jgi:3-hydroxyacyl-CoA dehydrogenase